MSFKRIHLAFLLAPILPSLFFIIAFGLTNRSTVVAILVFAIPFSYISCLVFGIPLMSFYRKKNCLNMINMSISGAILGVLVFLIFGFVFSTFLGSLKEIVPALSELISGALLGLLVTIPFCIIAGIPLKGNQVDRSNLDLTH